MVELVITGGIIAAAVAMVSRRPSRAVATGGSDLDLPCPWCRSDTAETDRRCPGCGQAFG